MSHLPENISFDCSLRVLFRLNCYMALIQVSSHDIIAKQYNPKVRTFKSCNTFSSTWLLVGFLLLFVFMYLFCLYQSMGMCIWWTSSLALWIFKFRLCSPACQSIVLISQKIFIMKQERFFLFVHWFSETVFSSDVVRSLTRFSNSSTNVSNSMRNTRGCWRGEDASLRGLRPKRGTFFNHRALLKTDLLTPSLLHLTDEVPCHLLFCSGSALGLSSAVAPPHMHFLSACGGPRGFTAQNYLFLPFFNQFSLAQLIESMSFFLFLFDIYGFVNWQMCIVI